MKKDSTVMQFILIAYDGLDEDAKKRRLLAREDHIKLGDKMVKTGSLIHGGALLDENNNMIGSILICEFDSRNDLNKWLEIEPYVTGGVWKNIEILPYRVGPSFLKKNQS